MKKFLAALMVVVMIFTYSIPKQQASADALVISQLAAAAYAIATSSGLNFSFTSGTAGGAQTYMEQRLTSWVGNQSGGLSIFGSSPVKALASKLAITQTAFNALKNFINDYITENSISNTSVRVYEGQAGGVDRDTWLTNFGVTQTGISLECVPGTYQNQNNPEYYRDWTYNVYYNGSVIATSTSTEGINTYIKPIAWKLYYGTAGGASWKVTINRLTLSGYENTKNISLPSTLSLQTDNVINVVMPSGSMSYPTVGLDDLQTYKRQDWAPDTNLDQMLQDIYDDVAINDLDLTGETVEDTPVPTPVPTNPPTTDIPGALGGIQEGINDLIGTQTDVLEGVNDIAGTLEGTQEVVEGIQEGIGSITEALDIPTASEANQLKLPDLRTLFPFCIPFDIYNIITAFNATPVAPHVQIPFNIPAIGLTYTFDLDFSSYNSVAAVLRTVEFVAYAIGLAILSSKVIRW